MPGVPPEKVPQRGHEARMCRTGSAVRGETEGEESAEGEGQTEQHHERISRDDQAGARGKYHGIDLEDVTWAYKY